MSSYIETIRTAVMWFPIIAVFVTIPFVLYQYHKYGSIPLLKSFAIYSFVLYLVCAYCLIILPLPSIEKVAHMTRARTQLVPFHFVIDFLKETKFVINKPSTYIKALTQSCFYVPLYNVFLTLPFGVYLKYFFNLNWKKTMFYSFLLSLFFELTQLTGIYFIYPRGYRLFDVDDLMINTFGSMLGYFVFLPVVSKMPTLTELNEHAYVVGKRTISSLREFTAVLIDLFIYLLLLFVFYLYDVPYGYVISYLIVYVIAIILFKGSTFGEAFVRIRVVRTDGKQSIVRAIVRKIYFVCMYFVSTLLMSIIVLKIIIRYDSKTMITILIIYGVLLGLYYLVSMIIYFINKVPLLYEVFSKTKMISLINQKVHR